MNAKTGGPAFPVRQEGPNQSSWQEPGLTLRDYFAAMAMQSLVHVTQTMTHVTPAMVVEEAYSYADTMLAERNRS